MRGMFNDAARMQRWLDVEAALAQAELGMIPERAAREIAAKACYEAIDRRQVLRDLRLTRHPLVPTVRALQQACAGNAGEYVHFGVTTQDIIYTGLVLQLCAALGIIWRELWEIAGALLHLARAPGHADDGPHAVVAGPADHVRLQGRRVAVGNGPAFAAAGGDGAQGVGRIDRRSGRDQGFLRG